MSTESTFAPRQSSSEGPWEIVIFDGARIHRVPLGPDDELAVGREGADVRVNDASVSRLRARLRGGDRATARLGSSRRTLVERLDRCNLPRPRKD
jgi:hypothetical protein